MSHHVRFDCYEVDISAGQLYKRGLRINLRDKSFQVLTTLLERPGEVVTREELRRQLWRDDVFVDFENNLNTAVARLREALGDSAEHPHFIETLPKRGYRFLAEVSGPFSTAEPTRPRTRLIVLPFLNLSGDDAQEYFSDAVTDEIITALANIDPKQLAVLARTTAMHYKGTHKEISRIGGELGVDYVVEGGVHRSDHQVQINVQLIQVSDETHLFAQKYCGDLHDIFGLQNSVVQAIAAYTIVTPRTIRIVKPQRATLASQPTENLAAYDAFIRGRYHLYKLTPEGLGRAKQLFEEAIARDSNFALAYDALAETYWWLGFLGVVRPKDGFSAGVFAALRAIEINPKLAGTHALLGMFRKELDYNWPAVQREMRLALELGPESPIVHFRYGFSGLLPQGRIEESVAELKRALERDPLSILIRMWLAEILQLGRQYDRALEQIPLLIQLDPSYFLSYFIAGQIRLEQGLFEEALSELRKAAVLSGNAPLVMGWLGMTLARSGDIKGALELLAALHAASAQHYILPTTFAWIHLALGEIDQAFEWLNRAIDERDPIIIPILSYAFLDPIRSDSRFHKLLSKMNLAV